MTSRLHPQSPDSPPADPPLTLRQRVTDLLTARIAGLPAWVVLTQLFIGLGWLRAATEKLIDPSWWSGGVLSAFLADHQGKSLGWYQPFLDLIVSPLAPVIAIIVVLGQVAASASLLSGRFLGAGLAVGIFLNLNFLAAGAVNPSAFYLLSQGAVALWLAERYGADLRTERLLIGVAIGAVVVAALSLPFVSTVHPAAVIDDPAVMMGLGGLLAALGCDLAYRRTIDARRVE